jgi:hypothetical protein
VFAISADGAARFFSIWASSQLLTAAAARSDLQVGGDEADAKRVKTEAGERFVPVHPELERLGSLRHWQAMQRAGCSRLFPDLRPGASGYYSEPFSCGSGDI